MASNMKAVAGTKNAYEYSETLDSSTNQAIVGEDIFIPSNVGSAVMMIRRKSGTGKFKVQATCSTRNEIYGLNGEGPAEWFNWDIPGTDSNGYVDEDEVQWWVPIPAGMRMVLEAAAVPTSVYFSLRTN